jgi:hypothetical protein
MRSRQTSFFDDMRMNLEQAVELSLDSLRAYGASYQHWAVAYSGGKDSSATVTFVAWAIHSGRVPPPKSLTILYADTGMSYCKVCHRLITWRKNSAGKWTPYDLDGGLHFPTCRKEVSEQHSQVQAWYAALELSRQQQDESANASKRYCVPAPGRGGKRVDIIRCGIINTGFPPPWGKIPFRCGKAIDKGASNFRG